MKAITAPCPKKSAGPAGASGNPAYSPAGRTPLAGNSSPGGNGGVLRRRKMVERSPRRLVAMLQSAPVSESAASGDDGFLRNLWYMAALGRSLKPGALRRQMLLGEPALLGRTCDGRAFALRDICPHRGAPLSAGKMTEERTVECPITAGASAPTASAARFPRSSRARTSIPAGCGCGPTLCANRMGCCCFHALCRPRKCRARLRAPKNPRAQRQAALDGEPDIRLRHRPCRNRVDGPGPCPLLSMAAGGGA